MSDIPERFQLIATAMIDGSPQAAALGMKTLSMDEDHVLVAVPWRDDLVSDAQTRILAGGVVTSLLDHASGLAVQGRMGKFRPIATLDLRIDYMRPAKPGLGITARAACYRLTRSVAFVRAIAFDADEGDLVATAQAAFMLNSDAGRKPGANHKEPAQ